MGVPIHLEKRDETSAHCVYVFGTPETLVGRVVLDKDSGDIELRDLSATSTAPSERFYLAHAVSRLHSYHDEGSYPASEQWEA